MASEEHSHKRLLQTIAAAAKAAWKAAAGTL
jgi:hypothetical protein